MNNLTVFNFENKEVRTLLIDNEPWFVGKDVADILGYLKPLDAISRHKDKYILWIYTRRFNHGT